MLYRISGFFLSNSRYLLWSGVLVLLALSVVFFTEKHPYQKTYSLSPKQVLDSFEQLKGEVIFITGYVESSESRRLTIKGRTDCSLDLQTDRFYSLPNGTEVIAKVRLGLVHGRIAMKDLYTYKGTASNRVAFSFLPIPVIIFLFFREFKISKLHFISRKTI